MKKILSFLLALAMILSLSVTAFAGETLNDSNSTSTADVIGSYVAGTTGGTIFSVDIAWTDMNFTYYGESSPVWDPVTHTYSGEEREAGWADSDAYITITNHSNAYIIASLSYAAENGYSDARMVFQYNGAPIARADNGMGANGAGEPGFAKLPVAPSGTLPEGTEAAVIGTITVSLTEETDVQNVHDWIEMSLSTLSTMYGAASEDEVASGEKYILSSNLGIVEAQLSLANNTINSETATQTEKNLVMWDVLRSFYGLEIKTKA